MFMSGKVARPAMNSAGGAYPVGLQDGSPATKESSCSSGLQEWSSSVAGKDLFAISKRHRCNNSLPHDWSGGSAFFSQLNQTRQGYNLSSSMSRIRVDKLE